MRLAACACMLALSCAQPAARRIVATPQASPTAAPSPTPVLTPLVTAAATPVPAPQTVRSAKGMPVSPARGDGQAASIAYDAITRRFGPTGGRALAVAACETGGTWNPRATGALGERGLFQIHPVHRRGAVAAAGYAWDQMYEVAPNVDVAYRISRGGTDWSAWTCKP